VSAPVGVAVTLGETAGVPGEEAAVLGDPAELAGAAVVPGVLTVPAVLVAGEAAELVEELQAVNSTAKQASDAQAAASRGLGAFAVLMMSNPST
jgi:hypothetical protein